MNMTMNINAQDNEKKISPDIEIIYKRLIEMIYEYRKKRGKSQAYMGNVIGVGHQRYSQAEKSPYIGKGDISIKNLFKICVELEVPIEEIVECMIDTPEKSKDK